MRHSFSRGLRYMAAGAFFFSVMSMLVKVAGQHLPSQEVVLARSLFMLLASLGVLRHAGRPVWGRERRLLVLRGLLGYGALSCFYFAVIHLPLADATVIQYTNPAFAAVLAVPVLAERVRWREAAVVLLSLGGVTVMMRPTFLFHATSGRLDTVTVGVALAGAILSASAYVLVRRLGAEDPFVIIFYFALISTVGSLPLVARAPVLPDPHEWVVLLGVGIATQFGQVYLTRGLHLERAGRATAVGYVQIVFAALWGMLFFGHVPDGWALTGALVIVGSTLWLARTPRASETGAAAAPAGMVPPLR